MSSGLQNSEGRAAWCAQMREFIDLVESSPEIPIPYDVDAWAHLQPRYCGLTHAQRVTAVHDFADRFGAHVIAHRDGGRQAKAQIGAVEVIVHAYPDKSPLEEQPRGGRVVSRPQDAKLMRDAEREPEEPPGGEAAVALLDAEQEAFAREAETAQAAVFAEVDEAAYRETSAQYEGFGESAEVDDTEAERALDAYMAAYPTDGEDGGA